MSNVPFTSPPYFGFLKEMIRRSEHHANPDNDISRERDRRTTCAIYEVEALQNLIGELECARGESERRIKFLEATIAEDI